MVAVTGVDASKHSLKVSVAEGPGKAFRNTAQAGLCAVAWGGS